MAASLRSAATSLRMTIPDSLLLVLDVDVLSINYAFVFLGLAVAGTRAWRWACAGCALRSALRLSSLVHLLGQLVRGSGQSFAGLIHLRFVVRLQGFLGIGERVFDVAAFGAGDLVAVLLQHLLDVVDHRVELVLGFD